MPSPSPRLPAFAATDSKKPRPRGCMGIFFVLTLVAASAWGTALGALAYILDDSGDTIDALDDFRPKVGSKVYSADGEELGEFAIEARQLVSLNEMPLILQKAFIATEDHKFYEHKGIRPLALMSAAKDSLRTGEMRGASTITQQIIRNVETTGVSKEITVQRKLREMVFALQLEREFTKDEILEMYLNQIFLGVSAYGVESAARQYFAKSVQELTLGECAMLAGLTRSPNKNNPFHSPENAEKRRDIVLAQMVRWGFITREEHDAAVAESVEESVVTPGERKALMAEGRDTFAPNKFKAPYFVEEVRQFISKPPAGYEISTVTDELHEGGLEIQTTIDMRLQKAAEEILYKAMDEFDAKKLETLTKRHEEKNFRPVSAALVCLDNREGQEGFIRAMVGGRDFDTKKFNTATQAKRQPGSSVKPFVWLASIDQGMTGSDIVVDEPIVRYDGMGRKWVPKNFDPDFLGPVPIRRALEQSVNIVSVKLVERLGFPLVRSYLVSAGFRQPISDDKRLTLGLGTPETTVLDQATCYSTIALEGWRVDPTMILEIKDRDGFTRYDYRDNRKKTQVFREDAAYATINMLQGVCTADARLGHYPSGHRTAALGRPRGGKTGTTNLSKDTWFCGFTPQFTCIVWFGYENSDPLGRGADYTGGRLSSPVWTEFMQVAHEGLPIEEFRVPPGVEFYDVDRMTGLAGGTWRAAFIRGTKPPTEMPGFELGDELEAILGETMVEQL